MSSSNEETCCPICLSNFDSESCIPLVFSCGHNICQSCDIASTNTMANCPTCRKQIASRIKNFTLIESLRIVEELRKTNEELKNHKLDYKCSLCHKWQNEEDLLICKTCVIDQNLLDLTAIAQNESTLQVVEVAMCVNCAYRNHIQKKHETVDMFPILSAHQFSNHYSTLEVIRNDYDKTVIKCEKSMASFNQIMGSIVQQFEKMLELARKSKTSKMQNEVIGKLNTEMSMAKNMSDDVTKKIREDTNELQKLINDIEKEKVENEKNCFEKV